MLPLTQYQVDLIAEDYRRTFADVNDMVDSMTRETYGMDSMMRFNYIKTTFHYTSKIHRAHIYDAVTIAIGKQRSMEVSSYEL